MFVAVVDVYWNVDVLAVNVPVTTRGVPAPANVIVFAAASMVWLAAMVKILSTVMAPVPVAVDWAIRISLKISNKLCPALIFLYVSPIQLFE